MHDKFDDQDMFVPDGRVWFLSILLSIVPVLIYLDAAPLAAACVTVYGHFTYFSSTAKRACLFKGLPAGRLSGLADVVFVLGSLSLFGASRIFRGAGLFYAVSMWAMTLFFALYMHRVYKELFIKDIYDHLEEKVDTDSQHPLQ